MEVPLQQGSLSGAGPPTRAPPSAVGVAGRHVVWCKCPRGPCFCIAVVVSGGCGGFRAVVCAAEGCFGRQWLLLLLLLLLSRCRYRVGGGDEGVGLGGCWGGAAWGVA